MSSSGIASISTRLLTPGVHNITAVYLQSANYHTSTAIPFVHTVTVAPLTIKAADASRVFGAPPPVFTATYTGLVNADTSAVLEGTLVVVTNATDASGPGTYTITPSGVTSARYSLTFTGGTLTVTPAMTSVVLAPSATTLSVGQNVVLNAQLSVVAPGTGVPTGTVAFVEGGTALGSAGLSAGGLGVLETATLAAGAHVLSVQYAGDGRYGASVSAPVSVAINQPATSSGSHTTKPAPTPVLASNETAAPAEAPPTLPLPVAPASAPTPAAPPGPAPAPAGPAAGSVPAPPLPVAPGPQTPPVPVAPPAPATDAPPTTALPGQAAPLTLIGTDGVPILLGPIGLQPASPSAFDAGVPDGLRIEVQGSAAPLVDTLGTAPQVGALGGGNAVRLAPPVDLNLIARDLFSNNEVVLPDGALEQTYLVSLPVIAEPANPNDTFTWLVEVKEDGQFLGYMRYPSTFDPTTNTLVYRIASSFARR